jgi:hypothetical protein
MRRRGALLSDGGAVATGELFSGMRGRISPILNSIDILSQAKPTILIFDYVGIQDAFLL